MTYQVLARKWRPKFFNEVVGQQHVLTILSNALSLGRVHHAYLFSGTRGVGKTSIARLLAKGLNCETGITATPCGTCHSCLDIEQGRFVDLLEIDAASRTKVEDTREILDNIQYLPAKGRFKVYLIDEVHMLSRSSFNALLKTLEEPPLHVKFLLATTDPQKLPITILSRCLHLHLSLLDESLISQQLEHILSNENIDYDGKSLLMLGKAAAGSMRDALSLTDQAIALGNGKIDAQSVSTMLGILDSHIPFSLVEALHEGKGEQLMKQIDMAAKQGANWEILLSESIALLHQIALLQLVPTALGNYGDHEDRIRFLAQYMAPNDVQLFYQILLMGIKDLSLSPNKQIGVEMCFLRALAFMPKTSQSDDIHKKRDQTDKNDIGAAAVGEASVPDDKSVMIAGEQILSTPHPASISRETRQTTAKEIDASLNVSDTHESLQLIPDEISPVTKNLLEIRMKLMQGDQNKKKSEMAEISQPKIPTMRNVSDKFKQKLSELGVDKKIDPNQSDESQNGISEHDEVVTAENYQWQATQIIEQKDDLNTKRYLASPQNEKTPEVEQRLINEIAQMDPWSHEIEQLQLEPLVKQIAINAYIAEEKNDTVILHARPSVKHLAASTQNRSKLADSLTKFRNKKITVKLLVVDHNNENEKKFTPQELRDRLYTQKLEQARSAISQDDKIGLICQFFDAQIDESSVRLV